VQRRIERPDRYRQAVHRFEYADKIILLKLFKLAERLASIFVVLRQNHRAHDRQPFLAGRIWQSDLPEFPDR
jgi:hypothetical protein